MKVDLGRRIRTAELLNRPAQVLRERYIQKQRPRILDAIRDYWFTIVIIFVLILAVTLFIVKDMERHKSIKLEHALVEVTKVKEDIQEELSEFRQEVREKAVKDAFELARHRSLLLGSKDRIVELLSGIKKERTARLGLEIKVNDIKDMLLSTMKAKGDMERKLMEQNARTGKIDIHSVAIATAPIVRGSVSIVNVEDNFVVVDLGKEERLTAGTVLAVYRDNRFIGRLLVVLVDDRVSIATIVPSWRDIAIIEEGDPVRTL